MCRLHKKFSKIIAGMLAVIMLVTTAFSITSEAAYGESHASRFYGYHIYSGIDVSTHNGTIDWSAVKAAGIDFAFIRVGGRGWGTSSGNIYVDGYGEKNLIEAKKAGIKVGVYFFSQAINEAEAREEANYAIERVKAIGISLDLPIVMDFEFASASSYGGRIKAANLSKEQKTSVCDAFLSTVKSSGYQAMLYADKSMLTDNLNASTLAAKYNIWLAQWNSQVTYSGAYTCWQYSDIGSVSGISGSVDMDYYYSKTAWSNASGTIYLNVNIASKAPATALVAYASHVQNIGWESAESYDGSTSGTTGKQKRLEAITIRNNTGVSGNIEYQVHSQDYGWMGWKKNGEIAGTIGESKRLEAIKIRLTGTLASIYDVYYRAHCQDSGWTSWIKNGETAGTVGSSKRMEAIQIKLVKKENSGSTTTSTDSTLLTYKAHVQTYGWMSPVLSGKTAGTTNLGKRMEAIAITLSSTYSGSVVYCVHGQDYGWQDWRQNGQMAGTTGSSKRLEAIRIKLTGELANRYDIYYRVHCQTYGWLGWAKNGEPAGTAGSSKRLEAIQIVLVSKNGTAPGATTRAYIDSTVSN